MNDTPSTEKKSWKYNLSTILDPRRGNKNYLAIALNEDDLNVHSEVDLTLDGDSYPKLKFNYKTKDALSTLFGGSKTSEKTSSNPLASQNKIWGIVKDLPFEDIFNGAAALYASTTGDGTQTSVSWAPWMKKIQAYDVSEPTTLELTQTFKFAMGKYGLWNAKEEVVKPILNLIAPAIPQYLSAFGIAGPVPSVFNLLANVLKDTLGNLGDQLTSFWGKVTGTSSAENTAGSASSTEVDSNSNSTTAANGSNSVLDTLAASLQNVVLNSYKNYLYKVKFGNFLTLNQVMITEASITQLSSETDQYGWPIAGEVELGMKSIIPFSLSSSTPDNLALLMGFN